MTFEPPALDVLPALLSSTRGLERLLFRHYKSRAVGQTAILFYNAAGVLNSWTGFEPVQHTNDADIGREQGLNNMPYGPGWPNNPFPSAEKIAATVKPFIIRVYMGGGRYPLSSEEVTALTTLGFAANIT